VVGLLVAPAALTVVPAQAADPAPAACAPAKAADSCSVTYNGTNVALTWTVSRINPECVVGVSSTNCVYSYQAQLFQPGYTAAGYAFSLGSAQTACGTTTPPNLITGGGDFRAPDQASFTCTTTFAWNTATQYPVGWTVNVLEQDGGGSLAPGGGHGFTTNRPAPKPTAAFTYTEAGQCEFTFTSAATSRIGGIREDWYSPPIPAESIPMAVGLKRKVWTHTFPKTGSYDVRLTVTDATGASDISWQTVTCGALGSSTTLTVKLASSPKSDAGRFNVLVNGKSAISQGKDGSSKVVNVNPGRRPVALSAGAGTSLAKYGTKLACTVNGKTVVNATATSGAVNLKLNDRAVCTFTNTVKAATVAKKCVVPKVVGRTLGKARKALAKAHCSVGTVKPKKVAKQAGKKAKVVKSSPKRGAVRKDGAKVKLTVRLP
jgi:hypothetical protein